jgi:LacI family transcriptional regulator
MSPKKRRRAPPSASRQTASARRAADLSFTVIEVAKQAGVSVATVSRVLNGKGPVRESTRRRVLAVAKKLRFVPNPAARSLITRHTNTVGVFLPDIYGEFFSEVIRGADATARQSGYHLLVSGSHSQRTEFEALLSAMRGRVSGLIIMSPDINAATLRDNLPESLPVVLLNCFARVRSYDSINTDNFGGAAAMVGHLARLGHRRIAIIQGPPKNFDSRERMHGYLEALRSADLERDANLEFDGDFREDSGYLAGQRIARMKDRPTAIFAANDAMAIGCLCALGEEGVSVPDEIAVGGFDDIPIARYMNPALTSVNVSIARLGSGAMERLLDAVREKNQHERRQEMVQTRLVVRQSCGAARMSAASGSGGIA